MKVILEINPSDYSAIVLRLILTKAEEWGVSPADAVARLLDELAHRTSENLLDFSSTIDEAELPHSAEPGDSFLTTPLPNTCAIQKSRLH
jgi:hypothetical protein